MPQGRKRRADDGEKRMKKECTEQDLQRFVQDAKLAFEDVTLTELDEDSSRYWQDDGLMVDYELRGGQVDCVLRRIVEADGKRWKLQMSAPLAGNVLPEERMTPRERELCRDDMSHDFLTGVYNRQCSAQSWNSGPGRAAAPLWPWWLWTRALSSAILTASR